MDTASQSTQQVQVQDWTHLPESPGCYLFKEDKEGGGQRVLYVGKAKKLRSRVRQYFSTDSDKRAFVQFIRSRTQTIEYVVVKHSSEALILENELIKKYRPLFNIQFRDDKRYLSLKIDLSKEWPHFEVVRKFRKDKSLYFGPFVSGRNLRDTLNLMQKIFPLRSCPDSKLYNRSRPCIEYDIKRCVAPCVGYVSSDAYRELVDQAILFLKGENDVLLEKLEGEMLAAAVADKFELAAQIRDRMGAVKETTQERHSIIEASSFQKMGDSDVVGLATEGGRSVLCLTFMRNGNFWDQRFFEFDRQELDDRELVLQFLSRYYSREVYQPEEILLPFDLEIEPGFLDLKLVHPRSPEKRAFLEHAERNAAAKLREKIKKREDLESVLQELKDSLQLEFEPRNIDCIDISHHQGTEVVASVVRFTQAEPNKDYYRRILLETQKVDDFASMKEAIERRYKSADQLPSLLMIDGGKGQLSSAKEVIEKLGYFKEIDLISLAKARSTVEQIDPLNPRDRERVFKVGRANPILLREGSSVELLLTYIRDEAHRFAIDYHRLRKNRQMSVSILDSVPGITKRLKLKLLKHFGSVDAISQASDLELLKHLKGPQLEAMRKIFAEHN